MDFTAELLKQGVIGLVAGIFFWLYMTERKEHEKTRDKYEASLESRRADAKETTETVTVPLSQMAQGLKLLNDKIDISKGDK